MFGNAFRGRRVLVTGHTGFKGAWLSHWLLNLGAEVTGVALAPNTEPALFDLLGLASRLDHRVLDIRDASALAAVVAEVQPEVVLHLAAQPLVRLSYAEPRETWEVNVLGTVNLLEAVRACPSVRACVVVTSDKCYENREQVWGYREADAMGGHDPYSASKGATELVAASYRRSYFHREGTAVLASARAGNVIGGGDWAEDRLIPDIWRTLTSGRPLELRYPQATRPWQHVLDPLAGYLIYLEHLAENAGRDLPPALNFGPANNESLSVAVIAEHMLNLLAPKQAWVAAQGKAPPEKQALALDASLAGRAVGWQPRLAARQALAWTADWYRSNLDGGDAYAATLADIARYEAL